MNKPLRQCPTCRGPITREVRERMGLRTNALLNAYAPGNNGPSDLDAALHNMHSKDGDRIAFVEYKGNGKDVPKGQQLLLDALVRIGGGHIRTWTLNTDMLEDEATPHVEELTRWVWPDVEPKLYVPQQIEAQRRVIATLDARHD